MKTLLSFLVFIGLAFSSFSQTCTGNFTLETQAAVDQFIIDNPTCTTIDGDLHIMSYGQIFDLSPLLGITEITGDLILSDGEFNQIDDFSGLANLTTVGGNLFISENSTQDFELTGLNNLTSIGGHLRILSDHIPSLEPLNNLSHVGTITLSGDNAAPVWHNVFPGLTSIDGSINLGSWGLPLDTLSGFNNLTYIGGNINLDGDVNHLSGFHNLQTIVGDIYASGISLGAIEGFENLQSVHAIDLYLTSYPGPSLPHFPLLTDLFRIYLFGNFTRTPDFNSLTEINTVDISSGADTTGFVALQHVVENFMVRAFNAQPINLVLADELTFIGGDFCFVNSNLSDLNFMSQITEIGGTVNIEIHPNLTYCEVQAVCDKISTNPEMVFINSNNTNCDEPEDFLLFCQDNYASGIAYFDYNCNGQQDPGEESISNFVVLDQTNNPVGQLLSNGQYIVPLDLMSTTTLSLQTSPGVVQSSDITITSSAFPQAYTGNDFAICPLGDVHNVSVFHYSYSDPMPGFDMVYTIKVQNNWPQQTEDVIVSLDFSQCDYTSLTGSPGYSINNDVISWNISQLQYGQDAHLKAYIEISTNMQLGDQFTITSTVEFVDGGLVDVSPFDNSYQLQETVVGSYDPNDINVNIEAQNFEEIPSEGLTLDYTIRFLNTGTAPAQFVRVTDIIEEDLNLGSIEILGSSHEFQLSFNENRQVEWLFENIQLPDSASDLEGSQGYIHYRIRTVADIVIDDIIENTAAIYFDYNDPVITNTATTIFYECPEELAITTEGNYCEGESIVLLATYGWDEYSWTVNDEPDGTGLGISIDNAVSGIYFITVESATAFCMDNTGFEFFVEETPNDVVITGDQEVCEGENIVLTASSEWDNYSWIQNGNEISTTSEVEITSPAAGNYVMQLLTTNVNCTSTMDVSFVVFANPSVIIDYNDPIITGPEGYTYAWYLNGELIEGETTNTLNPWDYVVDGMMAYAIVTGGNGCSAETNTVFDSSVDESLESFVEVYPNPMEEWSFIKLPAGNFEIELFNAIGQRLESWSNVQNSHVVHRNQLTSGAYMLKMTNEIGVVFTTTLYVR
jgi:uncharacterized repeat protein (TIGR01451 family)